MSDFNLTIEQLEEIISSNPNINEWYDSLSKFLPEYDINTPERIAAFLAQCAHESAKFKVLKENLNYRWESLRRVFPKYFPTEALAKQYAHKQENIANRVYANRMGNGPEESGDGFKHCGRGLIQLTGKNNYQAFADSIDMDIEELPEYLTTFDGCVQSAAWFWNTNNLNKWADAGDIKTMTRRINGGEIGLADRTAHYEHALSVLSA